MHLGYLQPDNLQAMTDYEQPRLSIRHLVLNLGWGSTENTFATSQLLPIKHPKSSSSHGLLTSLNTQWIICCFLLLMSAYTHHSLSKIVPKEETHPPWVLHLCHWHCLLFLSPLVIGTGGIAPPIHGNPGPAHTFVKMCTSLAKDLHAGTYDTIPATFTAKPTMACLTPAGIWATCCTQQCRRMFPTAYITLGLYNQAVAIHHHLLPNGPQSHHSVGWGRLWLPG